MAKTPQTPYELLFKLLALVVGVTSLVFLITIVATIIDRTYSPPSYLGPAVIGISSGLFALATVMSQRKKNGNGNGNDKESS